MDDSTTCPVCGEKLRNVILKDKYLQIINKRATFVERTCSKGINHSLQIFTEIDGYSKVHLLKVSLDSKYSKFIEIDFYNKRCKISCFKNNKPFVIEVPKIIEPDFPNLEKLKEKVGIYVSFS